MEELIYSKYSNERSRDKAIRTDILETENGRVVRKSALYPEAYAHIAALPRWQEALRQVYSEAGFVPNLCRMKGEACAEFEYLSSETLEEHLDRLSSEGKPEKAREELLLFLGRLKKTGEKRPFEKTEAFCRVFGDADLPEGLTSADVTNIDLVCQNLVLTEPPTVLDYEWTFGFPVPGLFAVYRAVHYFCSAGAGRADFSEPEILRELGITEDLESSFRSMEEHFQRYITGSHVPMRELYDAISPGIGKVEVKRPEKQDLVQVFFSDGGGYRAENSRWFPIKEEKAAIRLSLPENCRDIRIDPGDFPCMVKIVGIHFDGKSADLRQAAAQGGRLCGEWAYFDEEDPAICGIPVPGGAKVLEIRLRIMKESPRAIRRILEIEEEKDLPGKLLDNVKKSVQSAKSYHKLDMLRTGFRLKK